MAFFAQATGAFGNSGGSRILEHEFKDAENEDTLRIYMAGRRRWRYRRLRCLGLKDGLLLLFDMLDVRV